MKSFKEYLAELFDKPWTKTKDHNLTSKIKELHKRGEIFKGDQVHNIKAFKLEGDNGHMLSYGRNGALEVHHHDKDGVSGEMHNEAKKANPRFVATMKQHLEEKGLNRSML